VSGSEDCTLKLWSLPSEFDHAVTMEIHAVVTEKAHDKTISSVVVAPNDKFIATGSMDKTAKVLYTNFIYSLLAVFVLSKYDPLVSIIKLKFSGSHLKHKILS